MDLQANQQVEVLQSTSLKGDPRMSRAINIRLRNPDISLYEALVQGGFVFYRNPNANPDGTSDACLWDDEEISLRQRKNQLCRRLRAFKDQKIQIGKHVSELLNVKYSKGSNIASPGRHFQSDACDSAQTTPSYGKKRESESTRHDDEEDRAHKQRLLESLVRRPLPAVGRTLSMGMMQHQIQHSTMNDFLQMDYSRRIQSASNSSPALQAQSIFPSTHQPPLNDQVSSVFTQHTTIPSQAVLPQSQLLENRNRSLGEENNPLIQVNVAKKGSDTNIMMVSNMKESQSSDTEVTKDSQMAQSLQTGNDSINFEPAHEPSRLSTCERYTTTNHQRTLGQPYASRPIVSHGDFNVLNRMNMALQNYIIQSAFLLKTCMVSAGFDLNQTDESNIIFVSLYESIVQYERRRLHELLSNRIHEDRIHEDIDIARQKS